MPLATMFLLGVGVSADAFAVALGKGLQMRHQVLRGALILGFAFGLAQALMPLIGWAFGSTFADFIAPVDHWIVFGLLAIVGGKMIWEAFTDDDDDESSERGVLKVREVVILTIATSIDALAVGVSLALLDVNIWLAAGVLGLTTFVFSFLATLIGHRVGLAFQRPAEVIGGLVLIGIGVRVLIEHLMV